MTSSKKGYSSLSCISLPSLPTITEERSQPNRTRLYPKKEAKHLCAVFDFETFVLDSSLLTENEIISKRKLEPDLAITNMAVQEYINKRINTTITLIVIPSRVIKKLKTSRIPCLGKKKSIYITKYKNKKDGEFYMKLSTIKPSKEDKNKTNDNAIKCAFNGMVFAIIFSTFPSTKRFIINGVYYHGHGSPIYTPNFDGREKDLRACKPYDIFLPDTKNAIKTLKPFKRKRAKSYNGTNTRNHCNPIAMIKDEENEKRSKTKQRIRKHKSTRSKSSSSSFSKSRSVKKKKFNRERGKSDSLSTLAKKVSQNQGKRKALKQKKAMKKVKVGVCGEGLDSVKPTINSVLTVSLSPIKESKVMRMKRNKLQRKRNDQRS